MQFALIHLANNQVLLSLIILILHYIFYDSWSFQLLLHYIKTTYYSMKFKKYFYVSFFKFATTQDMVAIQAFWQSKFVDLIAFLFFALLKIAVFNNVGTWCSIKYLVLIDMQADASVIFLNIIYLIWAIVVSIYTNTKDIIWYYFK